MMYTSQEGELYVGQARALGAMGVLPKQVRPVDVSKVLYELHLLPDRRDSAEPALAPVELDAAAGAAGAAAGTGERRPAGPDWGRRVETTVKETGADIRRFIVASLDSFASRIVTDVRDALPAPAPPEPAAAAARRPKAAGVAVGRGPRRRGAHRRGMRGDVGRDARGSDEGARRTRGAHRRQPGIAAFAQ